jgi:hypothetical protein
LNALLDLNSSKGPGLDGVPPLILKNGALVFALPLSLLLNRSLASCVFPDRWKLSFVTLIFKSGKRNVVLNYRGIAILSTVDKLFELLVYRYEDLNGQLADCQHGFVTRILFFCFEVNWGWGYVRVLFYTVDIKLFLPVRGFQECLKIQSNLNRLKVRIESR